MVKYNQNEQKPWICDITGYETKNVNSNSVYTGNQEKLIMQTIGRNTTQLHITKTCAKNS